MEMFHEYSTKIYLPCDINDNCDNNEKTKDLKNLVESVSKHEWEYSRWEFSGWEFSGREFS